MNRHSTYVSIDSQAAVTDMYTPQGDWIHRTYKLQLEELGAGNLHYTSKFSIPIGTKLYINVGVEGEKVRLLAEVFGNQRSGNGKYSVGCLILYESSQQDRGGSIYHCPKHYVSIIN